MSVIVGHVFAPTWTAVQKCSECYWHGSSSWFLVLVFMFSEVVAGETQKGGIGRPRPDFVV